MTKSPRAPEKKKLSVKSEKVKDLSVEKGKGGSVRGGGGRTGASQPRTPSDLGCNPCN